ncbi:MAG: transcriptional regulator, TetR family [Frankiales bacterium]|nr:transcriptional regulator, TetR family [Frankiales bacterium]
MNAERPSSTAGHAAVVAGSVRKFASPLDVDPETLSLKEQRRLNRVRMSQTQVLDVAERLFGDNGYQQTSLEQVAVGSEFSVGAVHKMFSGKSGLLSAVMARRYDEMREDILEILAEPRPGLEEVLAICGYYLDYYAAHPSVGRLHLRVYATGVEPSADFAEFRQSADDGNQLFIRAIKRGQREGTIREGRPLWVATVVQALTSFDRSLRYEAEPLATKAELLSVVRNAIANV